MDQLVAPMRFLQMDDAEFVTMKACVLFNPVARGLSNESVMKVGSFFCFVEAAIDSSGRLHARARIHIHSGSQHSPPYFRRSRSLCAQQAAVGTESNRRVRLLFCRAFVMKVENFFVAH